MAELDRFNAGLLRRGQFVPVIDQLVDSRAKEDKEVRKAKKLLEKAKEKAARNHRASLVRLHSLLFSILS